MKATSLAILAVIVLSCGCQRLISADDHDLADSKSATQLTVRDLKGVPVIRISGAIDRIGVDHILKSLRKTGGKTPRVAVFVIAAIDGEIGAVLNLIEGVKASKY